MVQKEHQKIYSYEHNAANLSSISVRGYEKTEKRTILTSFYG